MTLLLPIGDTLFTTPAIHALRQTYPRAYIAAIAYSSNKGVLEDNPDIDELFLHPTLGEWWRWPELGRLFWRLRQRHFDLAVDMCTFSFFLSRVVCSVRRRIKLQLPRLWWLVPAHDWAQRHAISHYSEVVSALGLEVASPRLRLTLTAAQRRLASQYLAQHGVKEGDLLVAIHPGGEGWYGKKRWAKEGFARLADELTWRLGARIVLLGGGGEMALAEEVAHLMEAPCINGAGRLSLRETAALIERCHLFLGNDSSPLHLAAAVGTPVVGIYGPSNVANFGPYGVDHAVVHSDLPCSPCFHFIGSIPFWKRPLCRASRCLEAVTVEKVLAAALSLLEGAGIHRGV